MKGWHGKILWIDLTKKEAKSVSYPEEWAREFIGGRGLAIRILWEYLPEGADPLGPDNLLILSVGPLTGLPLPSSGKLVVAAKSPLTGGYGDGNVGSLAALELRKSGHDAAVIKGKAERPTMLYIEDDKVDFLDAEHLWGLDTWTTERKLRDEFGKMAGIIEIGPAGENMVKFATIISQEGRSGGRPGIGAVMGSKNLKAIIIRGTKGFNVYDERALKRIGGSAFRDIVKSQGYKFWMRQGTMATINWSQENSVLPTYNFKEGVFDEYEKINGFMMEKLKTSQRGCPNCNMSCGNVVKDAEGEPSELDYENVAMLGSNIGLGDLSKVAVLNRLADMYGLDTISLGSILAFATEASEKGLIEEKIEWGDYNAYKDLVLDIALKRNDLGALLAEGTKKASERIGGGSKDWAMNVKGLEISAYDCHAAPGMALAYATSPIGAHHKDAWVISWEVQTDRFGYTKEKAAKVVELQRIRGGLFESFATCRLPWVELGLKLDYYPEFLYYATGVKYSWEELWTVADRIYALIRAFWIRERGSWTRQMDLPPARWFKEPLTKGPLAGKRLDLDNFNALLDYYYELRGWDERGVPKRSTLEKLGLGFTIEKLNNIVGVKG